jgi:branched-chain amino acid transport system substrate-binding protein
MSRIRYRLAALATVAAAAAALAACGSSSSSNSSSSAVATSTAAAPTSAASPISVGYVNDESGPLAVPFITYGTQAAVSYVNAHGGVGGHPIKLIACAADGSPEKSIDCANQFVQAKVSVVLEGVDLGGDAMLPILQSAKIPLAGGVPFSASATTSQHAYFFDAAIPADAASPLTFFHSQGARNVVFFLADNPSDHFFDSAVLQPTAKALGITYRTLFYSATAPQWPVLAATAEALHPDVIGSPNAPDPDCAGYFSALKSSGYTGKIFLASCGFAVQKLGPAAKDAIIYSQFWWPGTPQDAPAAKRTEINDYVAAMKAAGQTKWVDSNAAFGFADVVTLSRVLSSIHSGAYAGPSVEAGLRATKGLDAFLGEPITCNHTAFPGQSACSTGLLFYKVDSSGQLRLASGGWVAPAAA